jgi:ABC-2 type transport system ATP-binding protein
LVAQGTPAELKRLVPGGHVRLEFADGEDMVQAELIFAGSTREAESLALRVPSDGGVGSLRGVLDTLDRASIEVDSLEIRTPDLDDVFLSLTGKSEIQNGAA